MRIAPGAARRELAAAVAAVPPGERVAIVDGRFTGHPHALRLALIDPRFDAVHVPGVLTVDGAARTALQRELEHAGTDARPAAAAAAAAGPGRTAAEAPASAEPDGEPRSPGDAPPLPDTLADALAEAGGVTVHRPELGALVAAVPRTDTELAETRSRIEAVDDEKIRLRSAVKSRDGFFTTYCISPYSRYLARWCARRGLTPNQVTTASLVVALLAACSAATGTRIGFVGAGVLLLASFVLDCTDGQLARYSLQYSTLGAWLDATFDRAKEYAYYAGLAVGAISAGGDRVWALALGAMVLQSCRHIVDFAYNEAYHDADGNTSPTAALSDRLDGVGWTVWARRIVVLPIGERWALIAVLTACTTPRITFVVLLVGCALAACYTTAGRVLRSLNRRRQTRTERAGRALAALADSGPIAEGIAAALRGAARRLPAFAPPAIALLGTAVQIAAVAGGGAGNRWSIGAAAFYAITAGVATARPLRGPLDWLVPPLFRAGEYLTVLALAALAVPTGAHGSDRVLPAAFGLVAAVAYHHYDTVYRIRGGTGAPPRWLGRVVGGHEGRVLVLTAAAVVVRQTAGSSAAAVLLVLFGAVAVVLAGTVLAESVRFWVSGEAPAVHDETGDNA